MGVLKFPSRLPRKTNKPKTSSTGHACPHCFNYGYPSKGFRSLGHYTRSRMHRHLNRRSQRKYHRPKGMSTYQYLQKLDLYRP